MTAALVFVAFNVAKRKYWPSYAFLFSERHKEYGHADFTAAKLLKLCGLTQDLLFL